MSELDELAAAVDRDPRTTAEAASKLARRFQADGDARSRARALIVVGRAQRQLGEIDVAGDALREAVAASDEAGDDEIAADAHLQLAAVLSFAGAADEAAAHLEITDRLGSARLRARAGLQRAAIAQRLGRIDDALAHYAAALPQLREEGATIDVARVLANRGVIRGGSGDAAGAVDDFTEAATLFREGGQDFAATQVLHNLGWAAARNGDIPRALAALDEAHDAFERLGHPAIEAGVDQAEALLAAGLSSEAATLADVTARRLAAAGNHAIAAEAWLLGAQAARVAGDPVGARTRAGRAHEAFAAQGSIAGVRAARLEELRSTEEGDAAELVDLAEALAQAGNAIGAVQALAVAATRAAGSGDASRAAALAAACEARAAAIGVVEARLAAAHATAVARFAAGDRTGARRRMRRGLDDLARHQGTLGAADARAHVAVHAREIAALGLREALDSGAAPAFEWMERVRAGALRHPAARPPHDPHLARQLAELRQMAADARRAELDGLDSSDLRAHQATIEASVRRARRHARGTATPSRPIRAADLRPHLDGRASVSLADVDGGLYAVVIDRRRSRLVELGPTAPVAAAALSATSALRDLAVEPARTGRLELLLAALADLDSRAFAPLRLPDGPLILVLPGPLHTAPWRSTPTLAGRAVTIAPSASLWLALSEAGAPASVGDRTLAVAGPRLREAEAEAAAVAGCYPRATLLSGADAVAQAVTDALGTAARAHLATHGHFRADNPLWSSLELADGPLTVYDLDRVERTPPLVVLSACESAVSGVTAGDEFLGMAAALLRLGTHSLIAATGPLPDRPETRDVLVAFHQGVAGGVSPAEALARADPGLGGGEVGGLAAACLGCFGLGLQ